MFPYRFALAALASAPLFAQFAQRPPLVTARPPHYVVSEATSAAQVSGLSPQQIQKAYGIDKLTNQGEGQTIALIDAYDHPNIEADLATFSTQFNLPACTTANGCFKKMYESASAPVGNTLWGLEISLDVEWAHAVAPKAKILLVETNAGYLTSLMNGVDIAVRNGASVVSMSFASNEFRGIDFFDSHFNVNNVVFTAASGDRGHGVSYPASSPFVVAVGGTSLQVASDGSYTSEVAWSGSGGGESVVYPEPSYQLGSQRSGRRGVPDVSYNADPGAGVAVYDSVYGGWVVVGGTSAGAPQWAALFAVANSMRAAISKAPLSVVGNDLYQVPSSAFHEIAAGSDGSCGPLCNATPGYDFVTGLGSPRADLLIPALVAMP